MTNGTASETNGIPRGTNVNDLLSCPFCGGEAMVRKGLWFYVQCTACPLELGASYDADGNPDGEYWTESEAIKAWNTRAAVTDHDCGECKERQGYYLDAETIQNQQERIAELTIERDAYFEMVKRVQADCDARDVLIRDMWAGIVREHPQGGFPDMGLMEKRMRELGIEV